MAEDFAIIETGESPQPSYDESTGKMHDPELNDGKGGKREPGLHETIKAAVNGQKAERDPVERHRQTLEKNGKTLHGLHDEVAEIDNLAMRDPIAGYRALMNKYGHDPRAVAQHLWNNSSPNGDAQAAEAQHANSVIAEFDAKHQDPMSKYLRPMAQKLLMKGDKRLAGCATQRWIGLSL